MTLKNNRAPLLCCFKLCASFHNHWWIQTGLTVRKHPIWVKFGDVLSHVILKFDVWPWKTIGHLSFAVSSFVQHFIAIGEFKLELQSGNAQFGSNSTIFFSRMTLKFDRWHWKTIGHLFYATSSFVHHFLAIGELKLELQPGNAQFGSNTQIRRFLEPCDLEIWPMTLKNNRAPLKCYFKLCASFGSHWWIQTGVTVRKCPIWVKIDDFFSRVTLQFDVWPWKTIGHLSYVASNFVHHFITIGEFKLDLQSGNAQFGSKSTFFFRRVTSKFDLWPWKTIGHLFYATSSFAHHFVAIGEFKLELQSGNAQSGSNSTIIAVWPWNLTDDLEKQ